MRTWQRDSTDSAGTPNGGCLLIRRSPNCMVQCEWRGLAARPTLELVGAKLDDSFHRGPNLLSTSRLVSKTTTLQGFTSCKTYRRRLRHNVFFVYVHDFPPVNTSPKPCSRVSRLRHLGNNPSISIVHFFVYASPAQPCRRSSTKVTFDFPH